MTRIARACLVAVLALLPAPAGARAPLAFTELPSLTESARPGVVEFDFSFNRDAPRRSVSVAGRRPYKLWRPGRGSYRALLRARGLRAGRTYRTQIKACDASGCALLDAGLYLHRAPSPTDDLSGGLP